MDESDNQLNFDAQVLQSELVNERVEECAASPRYKLEKIQKTSPSACYP